MHRIRLLSVLSLLVPALLGGARPLLAQGPPVETATLLVTVYDEEGRPLEGVNVTIPALGLGTMTTPVGQARLARVPAGQHQLEFSLLGHETERQTLDFRPGAVERLEVLMAVAPVALGGVEVRAEAQVQALRDAGFYQRQAMGFGRFLDREEIERRASSGAQLSDVFRALPGVRVQPLSGYAGGYALIGTRSGRACPLEVFVDGARAGSLGAGLNINELARAQDVEAIEVYGGASDVPMQYRTMGSSCGVALIWTRKGP